MRHRPPRPSSKAPTTHPRYPSVPILFFLRRCARQPAHRQLFSPPPAAPSLLWPSICEVHLTPGAHIVWVRGQMREASPSRPEERRGCGRTFVVLFAAPGVKNKTLLRRRDRAELASSKRKAPL